MRKQNNIVFIGIDPAFRDSGFCICILDESKEARFKTFKNGFMDFIGWMLHERPDNCVVAIENSNMQKSVWGFHPKASVAVKMKRARDVGKNQAASQYTVDLCREVIGEERVIQISPRQKGRKIENDTYFRAIVQQNGHTLSSYKGNKNEQDKRDAYMLMQQGKNQFLRI